MATVSRRLPERPHLDVPKREARELLNQWRNGEPEAFDRIRRRHPRFAKSDDSVLAAGPFHLSVACFPSISRPAGSTARWPVIRSHFNRTFVFRWLNQGIESTARVRAMTPRVILVR